MKKYILIALISLISSKTDFGQEINPLDFFPHHVGDLWQYFNHTQAGSEFWEKKVTAIDTITADSSIIITFNYRNSYNILHKIYLNDSLIVYWKTFGDWGIRYKFDAPLTTFWLSDPYFPYYTKYVEQNQELVFDDTLIYREYWTAPDTFFIQSLQNERLALGIGEYYGEFDVGITELIGCIINGVQYGIIISVDEKDDLVKKYKLSQNFPNPFNPATRIKYTIPERSFITLKVYDVLGSEVATLVNQEKLSGSYEVEFDGSGLSSGIYFYQLQAGSYVETRKMLLLK